MKNEYLYLDKRNEDGCLLSFSSRELAVKRTPSSYYSNICDFSIGIGLFLSSAIIDCVVHNNKGIILDYSNIMSIENKKIYLSKI